MFAEIEQIEVNLRCRISNYISNKYGVFGYRESSNFENPYYHLETLDKIDNEIKQNHKAPFIKNFKENYSPSEIPLYAAVEVSSFGTLSKFFKNMTPEDKKAFSRIYGIPYTYLESWFESIAYVRNICAHYGRLYNAKLSITPVLYKIYRKYDISSIRVFGVLCCMKHLLPRDEHWSEFVSSLKALFKKYPSVSKETMGFPSNWETILLNEIPYK